MNDVLHSAEAAELLNCSVEQVQLLARQKQLPAVQFGRDWVFPRQALMFVLNNKALENMGAQAANDSGVPTGVQPQPSVQRRHTPPVLGVVPKTPKEPA